MMPRHPWIVPNHPEGSRFTEELRDLEDKIDGLRLVLAMTLDMLPEGEVRERLYLLEETARKKDMPSETIAVVREFREKWGA